MLLTISIRCVIRRLLSNLAYLFQNKTGLHMQASTLQLFLSSACCISKKADIGQFLIQFSPRICQGTRIIMEDF